MVEDIDKIYNDVINDIKQDINKTQLDIMMNANMSLVSLYNRIGKVLYDNSKWGNKFLDKLAFELKMTYPNQKGFSVRNLKYMKNFYSEYKDDSEFVQLVAQLPWTHNIILIEKIKNMSIRKWYIETCLEEGWSKSILIYQIETNLYGRQIKSIKHNNFNLTLKQNSDLASHIMKDPYVFDIIELTSDYKEKELENKMLERLKNVILELGKGFSFVGNQYKISTKNHDYIIDLLFYHLDLRCYVVVELKTTEFKPEYAGQLGFYVKAVDSTLKKEIDNQTIGLLLCKEKDRLSVEWSLDIINVPIGVASYNVVNKNKNYILDKLPTEEEINLHFDIEE